MVDNSIKYVVARQQGKGTHSCFSITTFNGFVLLKASRTPTVIKMEWDLYVTVHRDKFLIIQPNRCTNFSNLFLERKSTCFGKFLCPSSGVFHCTHSNGTCHTGLLTACKQDQDGTPS